MSKYKWDLCELRNNIDTLKKLYEIENNENRKNLIIEYIEVYKNMINIFSENKNINNNLLDDSLQYDSINNLIEEQIISYNNNDLGVLNMVLQSYLPFREIYSSNYQLYEVPIFNTNEEVVELTNDFFIKMLPNNIIRDFKKLLMSKNMINFNTVKRNSCYSGITVIDPILEKKYVYVSRINQLIDLVTLPHELFHCLFNDFNTHLVTNYNMYYTTEVEGNFANILFGDYFYQNYKQNKNYFNQFFLELYHSGISELVIRNSFLDSLKDNKQLRMNKLNKNLEYWGIIPFTCKDEILDFLVDPLDINIKYTLGYLAAIDLYFIYLTDPEFAFYLLKNIRFIKCENDIISLFRRNHITFMDDGYENLKKYVKKIERQN